MKKKNDVILILALLIAAATGLVLSKISKAPGKLCEITADGERFALLSLENDCLTDVDGRCVIEISGGKVRFLSSGCPEQLCVNHRPISETGEAVICAPEGVCVRILGDGPDFVQ